MEKKLAVSSSLDGIRKLIAEFYYSTPEKIALTELEPSRRWAIRNGEKSIFDAEVVRRGNQTLGGGNRWTGSRRCRGSASRYLFVQVVSP